MTIYVVYFDQLLGAARTQKLVKLLFSTLLAKLIQNQLVVKKLKCRAETNLSFQTEIKMFFLNILSLFKHLNF